MITRLCWLVFVTALSVVSAEAQITLMPSSLTFTGAPGGPRPAPQSVTVTVPGGLPWTSNDVCPWFDASPQGGASGVARAVVPTSGWDVLSVGTSTCVITYFASGQPNRTLTVTGIKQAVSGLPPGIPSAPTLARRDVAIWTLTWDGAGTNAETYDVERASTAAGPFNLIATLPATVTKYDDRAVTKDTAYWYRLRSRNSVDVSAYSVVVHTP